MSAKSPEGFAISDDGVYHKHSIIRDSLSLSGHLSVERMCMFTELHVSTPNASSMEI